MPLFAARTASRAPESAPRPPSAPTHSVLTPSATTHDPILPSLRPYRPGAAPVARLPGPRRPGGARGPAQGRARAALRYAGPALAGYLLVRLLGVLVLAKWAHLKGHGLWPALATQGDAHWYLRIAAQGYGATPGDPRDLAFFPLHPAVVRFLSWPLPGSAASAGVLVSVLASLAAAWGVFAVGDRLYGRWAGAVLAVLWGATPVALVQWMGCAESLFTALAAWTLHAVLTGRWPRAGALAVLAGLARPTGLAVAAAVVVAAVVTLWQLWRDAAAAERRTVVSICLGALLAPLGWLAYTGWVGRRLGRWDGYLVVQRTWTHEWDYGLDTLRELRDVLVYPARPQLFLVAVSAILIGSVVMYALSVCDRQPPALLVFTGVLLVVVLGSGGADLPRARLLVPAFPLLLPAAVALARARRRVVVLLLATAALVSAYAGAYMSLVWPGSP